MKRFLITSQKFTGQAELLYTNAGVLCRMDCTDTDMSMTLIQQFKASVPAHIDLLQSSFSSQTVIIEAAYDVTFEMFYKEYPHKRNRYKVEIAWDKLNKSDQVKAFYSLRGYKQYLTRTGCFAMIGDRYLRDREFETEWNRVSNRG